MAQYFIPPNEQPVSVAPSLFSRKKGIGTTDSIIDGDIGSHFNTQVPFQDIEPNTAAAPRTAPYPTFTEIDNPTVVPSTLLGQFHFAFLIRHPKNSIPSYYRCCIPPLEDMTGFHGFRKDEAGYSELRRLFDYLRKLGQVGPNLAGKDDRVDEVNGVFTNGHATNGHITNGDTNVASTAPKVDICVIDADDLLDNPAGIVSEFCKSVGIDFTPEMLNWDTDEDHERAAQAFEKWKGFHEDAINSKDLKPRVHVSLPASSIASSTD